MTLARNGGHTLLTQHASATTNVTAYATASVILYPVCVYDRVHVLLLLLLVCSSSGQNIYLPLTLASDRLLS